MDVGADQRGEVGYMNGRAPVARVFGLALTIMLALILTLGTSCALYREDRCWIPPEQYALARDLFIQTGSLDLVQRNLEDMQWERCKINEAVYRLQKEFEVLPEGEPAAGATAQPAAAPGAPVTPAALVVPAP